MRVTDHIPEPSPWRPISNPVDLAVLGKLTEELNELGAALSRALIQGFEERSPDSGESNRAAVQDEVADVLAMIEHLTLNFDLDSEAIETRKRFKFLFRGKWFTYLRGLRSHRQ
jgi:NTP pyrophosphatase (non-canonical NTP hydrolase)